MEVFSFDINKWLCFSMIMARGLELWSIVDVKAWAAHFLGSDIAAIFEKEEITGECLSEIRYINATISVFKNSTKITFRFCHIKVLSYLFLLSHMSSVASFRVYNEFNVAPVEVTDVDILFSPNKANLTVRCL